ncbi:DUF6966 domain-containing protein [Pseudomonas sp. GM102]|uniref:DUF6966 domain-containing protein n=1 Tax=Pseudomonas sp. GM102 TaxID=1144321 RepID=UPI0009DA122E
MGPKTEQLICVLDQLAVLLESDGATHWSQWMRKARAHLLNSDYYGIEYLLSAYGGYGIQPVSLTEDNPPIPLPKPTIFFSKRSYLHGSHQSVATRRVCRHGGYPARNRCP